jgi:hypothetical protein
MLFSFIILKIFKKVNQKRYSLTIFIIFDIIIMGKNMENAFAINKKDEHCARLLLVKTDRRLLQHTEHTKHFVDRLSGVAAKL